ncbi:hypothetical protein [Ekhidna sp.]|uniref:hypothetical protein n=1 Tax=Ekhidna sp. TaxID=2608089 RepID=UPI003C7B3B2E
MNNKLYKIGFFALLIINIGLVVLFIFKPKPHMRQRGAREQISQKLAFSDEQEKQFGEMVEIHRQAIREILKEERTLVRSYFEQLSITTGSEDKELLLRQIMKLKKDKIVLTYNHFEKLKSICNEEQLAKFDEVIADVIPRLADSPGRPIKRRKQSD